MAALKLSNSLRTLLGDKEAAQKPASVLLARLNEQHSAGKGGDEVDIVLDGKHKHLFGSRLSDGVTRILCDAIIDSGVSVGVLNLANNALGDDAATELAKLLETGATPVRELYLNGNRTMSQWGPNSD